MKKLFIALSLVFFSLTLISCSDNKTTDFSIRVIFYAGTNATEVDPIIVLEENQLIDEPEEPTRSGFRFDGWFKDYNHTEEWDFTTDVVTKSMVLYAKWIAGYYSITYVLNGGTMPNSFVPLEDYPEDQRDPATNPELLKHLFYTVGVNNVLPRPTRTGYTFKNYYLYDEYQWEGAPAGTTNSWKPGDGGYNTVPSILSRDLVLYAHWEAIVRSITFDANYYSTQIVPGNYYKSRSFTYGFDFVKDSNHDGTAGFNRLPDFINFSHNGLTYDDLEYEFVGWNDKKDGTGTWFGDGTGVEGELTAMTTTTLRTLYGQWRLKNE